MKRILAFGLLFFISSSLFAAGAWETITGVFTGAGAGAAAGAALGSLIPGLGTVIGAAIGGLIGGVAGHESGRAEGIAKDEQAIQNYYDALDAYEQIENAKTNTELTILQNEANISAFDQTLARWQTQYESNLSSLEQQASSVYTELMNNWQGIELAQAAKGQTGGSGALVAQQAKNQIINLVGSDLKLDAEGGSYGTALSEFKLDSIAGRNELIQNKMILQQGQSIYSDALEKYRKQLGLAKDNITSAKNYLKNQRGITI